MAKRKKSKTDPQIQYRDRPNDNQQCSKCVMYIVPNECSDVAGFIRPNGWCRIFERRK